MTRLFCEHELSCAGWKSPVAQINQTHTSEKGTIRGMHFQLAPHAEMKLVSCIRGKIWDVVVDVREESPTFLQWHAEIISAENNRSLLIPEGFAHGFQTLEDNVDLVYLHSTPFNPDAQSGLNYADPALAIKWPIPVGEISMRDKTLPFVCGRGTP